MKYLFVAVLESLVRGFILEIIIVLLFLDWDHAYCFLYIQFGKYLVYPSTLSLSLSISLLGGGGG